VVTAGQLESLGLSARGIRNRATAGRLRRLHRNVYAVERPRRESRWMAAVLACGADAVLSHRSAAALWGLCPEPKAVDVALAHGQSRARPGVTVRRMRLGAADVTTHEHIPCTTATRTLIDLAAVVDRRRLELAVDRAEELRVFDLDAIRSRLHDLRGHRGTGRLTALLDSFDGPDSTRSAAEARLLTLIRRARLPMPEVNAWLPLPEGGGYRPDFLWRGHALIVEVDGRTHHSRRSAFERDRRRDRRLARLGYETRRYTAREVYTSPHEVTSELTIFLTQPSVTLRPE
jgi:very-short-patch-repair endonuclease